MTEFFDAITIEIQNASGTWVDVGPDVIGNPSGGRGIMGRGPTDLVEDPGSFTFSLNNSESNSAGTLGYYSPNGTGGTTLARPGRPVRVGFTWDGITKYKWAGYIAPGGVIVAADPKGLRIVTITCQNWFGIINTYDLDFLDYATNKRIEEAVELIIQELPIDIRPVHKEYATGEYTFPDVFDLMKGETKVVGEFQKLAMSEGGRIYTKANDSDGNTLVVESIHSRNDAELSAVKVPDSETTDILLLVNGSDQMLLANGTDKLLLIETQTFEFTDDHILKNGKFASVLGPFYSHVKASVVPRRVDAAATTVLWTMEGAILVAAGTTVSGIRGRYRDPSGGASYVNGIEIVPPASTTDFRAFANADGTGTEYTVNCLVTPTTPIGTAEIELSIQNIGANDFYVGGREGSAKFQVRGKGVYIYDTTDIMKGVPDSYAVTLGRNILTVDFPYHADPIEIQRLINLPSYAESLAENTATSQFVDAFPMLANRDTTSMAAFMGLDVGSKASWSCELISWSDVEYFINSYTFTIIAGKYVEWAPMLGFHYFIQ